MTLSQDRSRKRSVMKDPCFTFRAPDHHENKYPTMDHRANGVSDRPNPPAPDGRRDQLSEDSVIISRFGRQFSEKSVVDEVRSDVTGQSKGRQGRRVR